MRLLNKRIVQDVDLEVSFDEFISLSARMGAARMVSQRHGTFFQMSPGEMREWRFKEDMIEDGVDQYVFWYNSTIDAEAEDYDTVEF